MQYSTGRMRTLLKPRAVWESIVFYRYCYQYVQYSTVQYVYVGVPDE